MSALPRSPLTRRDLLRVASILGGSALLAACQQAPAPAAKPTEAAKPAAPAAAAQPTTAPAAAAAPAAAPAGPAGGVLNYAESADFNDFNPWSFTAVNFGAYNQLYSRLFWKDGTGKVNADIATAWEMAPDNLSFKVTLRQDVKWHDGKPLTAQDFVDMYGYTKDEVLSKYLGVSKVKGIMTPVKDVKATDPYTLVFSFDKPTPYITDILDYFFAIRITDKADPQLLKSTPIGTGPFKLAKWTPNQFSQMDKNPDFYLKGQPLLDQFMFKRFSQAETLAPNLKSGAVDDVLLTSLSDVGPLQADTTYNVEANENAGSIYDLMSTSGSRRWTSARSARRSRTRSIARAWRSRRSSASPGRSRRRSTARARLRTAKTCSWPTSSTSTRRRACSRRRGSPTWSFGRPPSPRCRSTSSTC